MPLVCQKCGHSDNWDAVPAPKSSTVLDLGASGQRAALAEIQAEIARFKTYSARYISVLEKQQHDLESKLEAIVFPVLSLPAEITSRIFVECLPDNVSPSTAHAPLLLTRVCRQWEDIALSTCQLWSSLHLDSFSAEHITAPDGTLQTWFSRARACPLSLTIQFKHCNVVGLLACTAKRCLNPSASLPSCPSCLASAV
ncbi:hypothetical protein C8R45DRAFT_848855 [Mycena sanguinolenta]|nr:hypothetical protein C8R45DRAFT_848855 [Mycena sanguinolenta]